MKNILFPPIFCVLLFGCKPSAPPEKPATETPPPLQESVAYLQDEPKVHGYLARPANNGSYAAVLVLHDRMGLTNAVKDEAFRLAQNGYVALAVDLFRGQTPKTEAEAKRLQDALPKKRALSDLKSAVDYLCDRPEVRKGNIEERKENVAMREWNLGVVGLGMGGMYALEAAERDERLRAVALCYSPLPTEAEPLKTLKASVFYIRAAEDKSLSNETLAKFCQAMAQASKHIERIREYGKCSYGFLDPAFWPIYGTPPKEDVQEAWELITRYLDRELN
jgi:carboxymethylenebutenolidase